MLTRDPEYTFSPMINNRSKRKKARGVRDMSRGDAEKIERRKRLLRLQREQKELEGVTFKPQLYRQKEHTQVVSSR